MLSSPKPLDQKETTTPSNYDLALNALIEIAEISREPRCDSDAFLGNTDGYAKIISRYLHKLEPIVAHQVLTQLHILIKQDSTITKDHPLIPAIAKVLEQYKESKKDLEKFQFTAKIEDSKTTEQYKSALSTLLPTLALYSKDETFQYFGLKDAIEEILEYYETGIATSLNKLLAQSYLYMMSSAEIPKDHPLLKAYKTALDHYPYPEKLTLLHHAILGRGFWWTPPSLTFSAVALMSKDIKINAVNAEGDTALHAALKKIHDCANNRGPGSLAVFDLYTVIKFLIMQPGMDLTIRDKQNKSALDYIAEYDDLTLVALQSGKLKPSDLIENEQLLSLAVKNRLHNTFKYLVTDTRVDLNNQNSNFVCMIINKTKTALSYFFLNSYNTWAEDLLKNPHFIPFKATNNAKSPDERLASYLYNTEILVELLKTKNQALLVQFIVHPNSSGFVRDEKEYDRLESLAQDCREAKNIFACRKILGKAEQALQKNDWNSAIQYFNKASGGLTFESYINEVCKSILAGKLFFSKELTTQFIEYITKNSTDHYRFETNRALKMFYEGHGNFVKPDILLVEHFHSLATYRLKEMYDTDELLEPVCLVEKQDTLRDPKIDVESAIAKLAKEAKTHNDCYISAVCSRRDYDMRSSLLKYYVTIDSKHSHTEVVAALHTALLQMPKDYNPTKANLKVEQVSVAPLGLFSSEKTAVKIESKSLESKGYTP